MCKDLQFVYFQKKVLECTGFDQKVFFVVGFFGLFFFFLKKKKPYCYFRSHILPTSDVVVKAFSEEKTEVECTASQPSAPKPQESTVVSLIFID